MGSVTVLWLITLALWLIGFALMARLRRGAGKGPPASSASVSLIIPARNEEHNLPTLLGSLATQPLKPREIIVVDDGSTDRTAALARQLGAAVIASQPLPYGWRGKTWACHQGAMRASGEQLIFMDADTWFEPGGLGRVLFIEHDGALSVIPYHAVRKSHEDLSMFFNISMIAGTVPKGLVGQFLLVRRNHYQLAGGHESVRGHILENFRMAGKFLTAGVPLLCVTGRGILSFRMYPGGLRELLQGWTKGFAAGAGGTPAGSLILVIAWLSCLMLAPLMLLLTGEWWIWGCACVVCALQVAWVARTIGSFGWALMLFYPLPLMTFFGLFAWSAMRSGRKVTWKGREISAD